MQQHPPRAHVPPPARTFPLRPLALAVALGLSVVAPGITHAQGTQASQQQYDLPAGPLDATLTRIARQAGRVATLDPKLVAGLQAAPVKGEFSPEQAFTRALAGTGLEMYLTPGGALSVRPAPVADKRGEALLAPVTVTAGMERSGTTEGTGSYTTRSMSSATHLPLTMRETPQSVTVLTSARIEADNLVDLVDVVKATPGLTIYSGDMRPKLQSRGYEIDTVTQDGITSPYSWSTGDSLGNLAMQDRVEVVRGATGLMQGAGNPAAAINMIRKRPTSTWQFKGSASTGSWDDYRLMADISGPLTEDGRVRGRVVAYGQDASDFYDLAFNHQRLGYVTVDVDLTDRTTLNIGYSHLYANKNHTWGGLPMSYGNQHLNLPRSTFAGADWEYNKNRTNTLYANLAHDFGEGWKLDINATYVDDRDDALATWLLPTTDVGGYGHEWWTAQSESQQKAADLKVSGPVSWFGRRHDLVFGATVNRQKDRSSEWYPAWDDTDLLTRGVDLANWNHVVPRPDISGASARLSKSWSRFKRDGLYSAGRFNLADTLDLLLGARLDWHDRSIFWDGGGTSFAVNAHLTKYAGLTWKFAEQHSAYVSYTDVFQPQNVRDPSGSLLDPKVGVNYEIGLKGEYLGGALNASIALFRIDESNRPVLLGFGSPTCAVTSESCYSAADQVRTEGVDIELQGALTPNWQIGAGLTWSETRYRKDTATPANVGKRIDTLDPTTLFKLSTQYTLPGELSRLTLGGRINWQSKMYYDGLNANGDTVRNQQGARTIVDLSATYRLTKNLNLKLDINNVFDKVYYTSIGTDWYWGASEAYGRPRNILLTLNASY